MRLVRWYRLPLRIGEIIADVTLLLQSSAGLRDVLAFILGHLLSVLHEVPDLTTPGLARSVPLGVLFLGNVLRAWLAESTVLYFTE